MNTYENNRVANLCAAGMEKEASDPAAAADLFGQAWQLAATDDEKAIAAHYAARQQPHARARLEWNKRALCHAQRSDKPLQAFMPSLYLNIGKDHEDLGDKASALNYYRQAREFAAYLEDDGYGNMLRRGIEAGIERVSS